MSAIVVVTFKDEDCAAEHDQIGPVLLIRRACESPDEAAAREAGLPFAHEPHEATDLGWKTRREALAIAANHGVTLTDW
jgi:hypothetical protein